MKGPKEYRVFIGIKQDPENEIEYVEAQNQKEAIKKVRSRYNKGEIIIYGAEVDD